MDSLSLIRYRGNHALDVGTSTEAQDKYMGLYKAAYYGNFPDVTDPAIDRNPFQFPANVAYDSPTSWVSSRDPGNRKLEQYGR